jgi:hypothetical protein
MTPFAADGSAHRGEAPGAVRARSERQAPTTGSGSGTGSRRARRLHQRAGCACSEQIAPRRLGSSSAVQQSLDSSCRSACRRGRRLRLYGGDRPLGTGRTAPVDEISSAHRRNAGKPVRATAREDARLRTTAREDARLRDKRATGCPGGSDRGCRWCRSAPRWCSWPYCRAGSRYRRPRLPSRCFAEYGSCAS